MQKLGLVLVLQRVEERVLPEIEFDVDIDDGEIERDHHGEQQARHPALFRKPVRAGQRPQVAQKGPARFHHSGLSLPEKLRHVTYDFANAKALRHEKNPCRAAF
ncbi:hypothetical protein D3C83_47140 [compost metagenome]